MRTQCGHSVHHQAHNPGETCVNNTWERLVYTLVGIPGTMVGRWVSSS